ncbi:CidA/LrgA family protein [Salirhabdus salicampi]|uniref:CidA/LrgA family protein n=1 Tax=Salirhabdus salicampi TaxID=476102 RepID=UPI00266CF840|nr:CidA/LrgA family protein [Salirhabdus salicampi]
MIGNVFVKIFNISFPASIVGMFLLFTFLLIGYVSLEWIEAISSFQLKHLTLLFIPPR